MNSTPTFARMERPSAEAKGSSRPGRPPGSTRGEDPATERTRRHRWWSGCARCDGMAAAEAEAAAARGWGTATATATATATGSRTPNAGVSAPRSGGRSSSTCDAGRSWSRLPVRAWSWSCFSAVVDVLLVVELRLLIRVLLFEMFDQSKLTLPPPRRRPPRPTSSSPSPPPPRRRSASSSSRTPSATRASPPPWPRPRPPRARPPSASTPSRS